jgi:pilus assembly protein CpaC
MRLLAIGILALTVLAGQAEARTVAANANGKWDDARVISVSASSNGPAVQHITLGLNKAAIVQLDSDARDVMVSNPAIVDAVVRTPRRVFLLGVKTGQANAFFFDAAGRQILSIDIHVERDVSDLSSMMHLDIPDSDIHISALNDNIVLTGSVANAMDSARAQDLAARVVDDPKKVLNMLRIKAGEQVLLKVRVAEIERDVSKQFGINLQAAVSAAGVPIIAATANPYGLLGQALAAGSGIQLGNVGTPTSPGPNNLQGVLNALEQVGLVHTLAEPNLVAVSGETAKFLAGGEFPVPVSRDQYGNVVVDFKQFGVGLSFTPIVLSPNRISLQVSTEVSELTNEGAFLEQAGATTSTTGTSVTSAGLAVPALAVRRAETTIELPSGGSFAIAGLMQHVTKQDIDGFPGLKDMPVLGALFRSRDFQNNETELVVIVSAYLVNPTMNSKLAGPTDGFVPATDVDTILNGKVNTVYTKDAHGLKAADDGKVGFIVE